MEVEEEIRIVEKVKFPVKGSTLIVGIPDVGLVGVIASSHLIQTLKMSEVGYVDSDAIPPIVVIHENEPKSPIRLYNSGNIIILTTEIVLPTQTVFFLSRSIVRWAASRGVNLIMGITGLAVPNRLEIEKPAVYGIGSTAEARELVSKAKIKPFDEGLLVGAYATLLRECLRENMPNITLLAEAHLQFPDPGASASIIESLNNLLNLNVDVKELIDKAEEIRIKARELMRRTEQQLRAIRKTQEQSLPGIYV